MTDSCNRPNCSISLSFRKFSTVVFAIQIVHFYEFLCSWHLQILIPKQLPRQLKTESDLTVNPQKMSPNLIPPVPTFNLWRRQTFVFQSGAIGIIKIWFFFGHHPQITFCNLFSRNIFGHYPQWACRNTFGYHLQRQFEPVGTSFHTIFSATIPQTTLACWDHVFT